MIAATAATVAMTGVLPGQVAASATRRPVIYNYAEGWHRGQIKPAQIVIGANAPYLTRLAWSHWTSTAYARGTLHQQSAACVEHHPSYQCPFIKYRVSVSLWRVRTHHAQPYFSKMTWRYRTRSGRKSTETLSVIKGYFNPVS